ncbi:hypothetical protein, partial [Paraburkholderia sp. SIMBA_027]|uniref:hypothetical protein n=1 Tax=Paraburkholderia sp. SIMBA_027 TaxID=3085770 RepID=UPI00397C9BD6
DTAGAEDSRASELKIQLVGPLTIAANLYLHNGERALLDYGARRDIAESLAVGVADHIRRVYLHEIDEWVGLFTQDAVFDEREFDSPL